MMKEKKRWIQFLLLVLSAAVMAFDTNVFIRVGNLSPGGVGGLALLLQSACELFFHVKIPYSVFYLLFNAIPLYIGFRYLGRKFTLYSCFVIVLTSVFTDIMPSIFITDDLLLCALFGGLLCGFSIGLALIAGATSGGTDFISIYLSEKKGVDAWNIILCYNAVVSILTGFLHGWDKTLYSIIVQFLLTQVIQMMYKRYQQQTLLIVTDYPDKVYKIIHDLTRHSATILQGMGSYQQQDKTVVYSVISREESSYVIHMIRKADPGAFINLMKTESVTGQFYIRPNS